MTIRVYYGSQQGTASKFAKILEAEGKDHGFLMKTVDLQDAPKG
jgi:flavodoxin